MTNVTNMDLLCMILKNQELIMRALGSGNQDYYEDLIMAADAIHDYCKTYRGDEHTMHEQLMNFAGLLFHTDNENN